jgi:predicted RNA-binding protein with RPS1 domain
MVQLLSIPRWNACAIGRFLLISFFFLLNSTSRALVRPIYRTSQLDQVHNDLPTIPNAPFLSIYLKKQYKSSKSLSLYGSLKSLLKNQDKFAERYDLPAMGLTSEELLSAEEAMRQIHSGNIKPPPELGDTLLGRVVYFEDDGAMVEIGGKMLGYLPVSESSLQPVRKIQDAVKEDDEVEVEVIGTLRGVPVLSMRHGRLVKGWASAAARKQAGAAFRVRVQELNKGGAVCVTEEGLRAFLPASQTTGGVMDISLIGSNVSVRRLYIALVVFDSSSSWDIRHVRQKNVSEVYLKSSLCAMNVPVGEVPGCYS